MHFEQHTEDVCDAIRCCIQHHHLSVVMYLAVETEIVKFHKGQSLAADYAVGPQNPTRSLTVKICRPSFPFGDYAPTVRPSKLI